MNGSLCLRCETDLSSINQHSAEDPLSTRSTHPTRPPAFVAVALTPDKSMLEFQTSDGLTYRLPVVLKRFPQYAVKSQKLRLSVLAAFEHLRDTCMTLPLTEIWEYHYRFPSLKQVWLDLEMFGPGYISEVIRLTPEDIVPVLGRLGEIETELLAAPAAPPIT